MLNAKLDTMGAQPAGPLDQPGFFGDVIGELSGLLEDSIGINETEGFISTVGGNLGQKISAKYSNDGATGGADRLAAIMVDLKSRIGGDFKVVTANKYRIVLTNSRCPFGDRVKGRPSLCMMTANVFGRVAADRNGFAHVEIEESIASGHANCRVVVSLSLDENSPDVGFEFFGAP